MLVKIEFRQGSFLVVDAGDIFPSADACRDAFMELLDDGVSDFFKFNDCHGQRMIIKKGNINRIEVGYEKGAGERFRSKRKR